MDRLLYSRKEAAEALCLSLSSVDILIGRGMLRVRRQGRRLLIPQVEIEKMSRRDLPQIWPPKENGKTTRALGRTSA